MILRIESFSSENEKMMKDAYKIRYEVFVNEQHVDKNLEYDGLDSEAVHYVAYYDEFAAATARWRETKEGIKLERFAVLANFRKKYIGAFLLIYILDEIKKSNKKIYLHAQDSAVNFYKRLGFEIEGNSFTEADIIHYKMIYKKQNGKSG
jgi:predicted GNAT family N-acyltransferase